VLVDLLDFFDETIILVLLLLIEGLAFSSETSISSCICAALAARVASKPAIWSAILFLAILASLCCILTTLEAPAADGCLLVP